MTDTTLTTPVCFRVDDTGEVCAVFPFEREGTMYACYAHIGQHSDASRNWVLGSTRPAYPQEYTGLQAELEGEPYGYRLDVRAVWPRGA